MGASQAVHSGKCAMHKLGIQVLPSPDMMAIMDAKDMLCKVTMLRIRSEDMLAYDMADEFGTGFKKRPAFQLRGIKQNTGTTCEGIWITLRFGGNAGTRHRGGVCGWLHEDVGFPAARHQAERRLVRPSI